MWMDPNSNIFLLDTGSPCLEAGNNNHVIRDWADLDDDGNTTEKVPFDLRPFYPRQQDDDMNGSKDLDMGCYERGVGIAQ